MAISAAALSPALLTRAAGAQLVNKHAEQLQNGEFNWFPQRSPSGPILIIVSLPDQIVHVYRNGVRVAASTCSSGKAGHRTPTGVFKILQKDRNHHSSTYNNAPMPNMNRLTWQGVALHAGNLPGYPASHGCVRLPMEFSKLLFGITKVGMTVVIADDSTQPASVVHPGMVLGDYARNEFGAVDMALKRSAYSEGFDAKPRTTSVVISAHDRTATVLEGSQVVAGGKADILYPGIPLGNRSYVLSGSDTQNQRLSWIASQFNVSHKGSSPDDTSNLRRVKVDPSVRDAMRKRMHNGMTLVTTDEPATAKTRSSGDFVILHGLY